MSDHTFKAIDREFDELGQRVIKMGALAAEMLRDAMSALSNADVDLARAVVHDDLKLDALQREVDNQAIVEIARRQPVAMDLREIIGAMRIAGDLERVGDLAKNIARRATKIGPDIKWVGSVLGLRRMADLANEMLADALESYRRNDAEGAQAVWSGDAELNSLEDAVFRDILTRMMEDSRNIEFGAQMLFCSKNLERIGDHATNIAESICYIVTGSTRSGFERKRPTASLWQTAGRGPGT